MSPEFEPPQQSFLSWMLRALGYKYAWLLPLVSLVCLVLTWVVAFRARGATAGAALLLIVPVPLLIGLFAGIEHAIAALRVVATGVGSPRESQLAEGISATLVAPMVGLLLTAPGYVVATIGSLIRSFRNDTKGDRG